MIKFKIGERIYSPQEQPIMMIFEDNEDVKQIISNLRNIDLNVIVGERKWVMCPHSASDEEIEKFSGIELKESEDNNLNEKSTINEQNK